MAPQPRIHTMLQLKQLMMRMWVLILLIVTTVNGVHVHQQDDALYKALRTSIKGQVFAKGTYAYEAHRLVHNGGCRHIYPAYVVRPESTEDVSAIVKVATEWGVPLSVRSGGHSYQCTGTKHGSINVDMRSMRTVELVSSHEAILGAGNVWGQVLDVIKPEYYTMVHGQCLMVGVGGFLLGLGTNLPGTSSRFGSGADHVLEHTMVLADGSVAKVTEHNTTLLRGHHPPEVIPHGYDNDLRFALRTAGSSYGITTEFRYKIYPRPETLPFLIPVFIEGPEDFRALERVAASGRYSALIVEGYYFRRPALVHVVSL